VTSLRLFGYVVPLILASLVFAGCEEIDDSSAVVVQNATAHAGELLEQVKRSDRGEGDKGCAGTDDTSPSVETSGLLRRATVEGIRRVWHPPYAIDPRDIELLVAIPGQSDLLLSVMIRVENGQCVGYSLSENWNGG
jgi:hypothetical protein